MLSNLNAKSNLLAMAYQAELNSITAFELHSIYDRCPNLGISFDPLNYTLSKEQILQWEARHLWATRRVSIHDEDRSTLWIYSKLNSILAQEIEDLDEESAFELLWILHQAEIKKLQLEEVARELKERLYSLLSEYGYTEADTIQRIGSFSGK